MTFETGKSFLVTGDCPAARTYALCDPSSPLCLKDDALSADVLQAPHHGLPIGDPEELIKNAEFYKKVSPKICLFSQYSKRFYSDERFSEKSWFDNYVLMNIVGKENCYHHTQTTVVDMTNLEVEIIER